MIVKDVPVVYMRESVLFHHRDPNRPVLDYAFRVWRANSLESYNRPRVWQNGLLDFESELDESQAEGEAPLPVTNR